MQKVVLKLDLCDEKCKKKAMKIVSGFVGVDSMSTDMKEKKLTATGDMDPVELVGKLRKRFPMAEIVSVGPAKEPPKKEDPPKGGSSQKDQPTDPAVIVYPPCGPIPYHPQFHLPPPYYFGYVHGVEEDPNGCVTC